VTGSGISRAARLIQAKAALHLLILAGVLLGPLLGIAAPRLVAETLNAAPSALEDQAHAKRKGLRQKGTSAAIAAEIGTRTPIFPGSGPLVAIETFLDHPLVYNAASAWSPIAGIRVERPELAGHQPRAPPGFQA
jgi:hypothetical protein